MNASIYCFFNQSHLLFSSHPEGKDHHRIHANPLLLFASRSSMRHVLRLFAQVCLSQMIRFDLSNLACLSFSFHLTSAGVLLWVMALIFARMKSMHDEVELLLFLVSLGRRKYIIGWCISRYWICWEWRCCIHSTGCGSYFGWTCAGSDSSSSLPITSFLFFFYLR